MQWCWRRKMPLWIFYWELHHWVSFCWRQEAMGEHWTCYRTRSRKSQNSALPNSWMTVTRKPHQNQPLVRRHPSQQLCDWPQLSSYLQDMENLCMLMQATFQRIHLLCLNPLVTSYKRRDWRLRRPLHSQTTSNTSPCRVCESAGRKSPRLSPVRPSYQPLRQWTTLDGLVGSLCSTNLTVGDCSQDDNAYSERDQQLLDIIAPEVSEDEHQQLKGVLLICGCACTRPNRTGLCLPHHWHWGQSSMSLTSQEDSICHAHKSGWNGVWYAQTRWHLTFLESMGKPSCVSCQKG